MAQISGPGISAASRVSAWMSWRIGEVAPTITSLPADGARRELAPEHLGVGDRPERFGWSDVVDRQRSVFEARGRDVSSGCRFSDERQRSCVGRCRRMQSAVSTPSASSGKPNLGGSCAQFMQQGRATAEYASDAPLVDFGRSEHGFPVSSFDRFDQRAIVARVGWVANSMSMAITFAPARRRWSITFAS